MTLYEVAQREARIAEREKVVQNIVHNMLQQGVDYQTIASYTNLSVEEVALMAKKVS